MTVLLIAVTLQGQTAAVQLAPAQQPDRRAFLFTHYDLALDVDAAHATLAVRGHITLHNDSVSEQSKLAMQISSSLKWVAVKAQGEILKFKEETIDSGADHTGTVNELSVDLFKPVPPGADMDIEVAYKGQITLNGDRLVALGAPVEVARRSDWDRITPSFTAIRGAGYVLWYPVAIDPSPLDSSNRVLNDVAAWRSRNAAASMHVRWRWSGEQSPRILTANGVIHIVPALNEQLNSYDIQWIHLGVLAPVIVAGEYFSQTCSAGTVYRLLNTPASVSSAPLYQEGCNKIATAIADWTGHTPLGAQFIELPENTDAPYDAGATFLTAMRVKDVPTIELQVVHALSHAALPSFRPWIEEGVAHYLQARTRELQGGRNAAIHFMDQRRPFLEETEKTIASETMESLVQSEREVMFRTKGMYVWWMLHDMIGDKALTQALATYSQSADHGAAGMQRLLESQSQKDGVHKDLEWFFDDWVYRDRGLPDFSITNVVPREGLNGSWLIAVTVENLGNAGAEVPVRLILPGGETLQRVIVKARDKLVVRIPSTERPTEVIVNDGSVPESDYDNNRFVLPPKGAKQ